MDAEYLKDNIGDVLASGLTHVVVSDPSDPVDCLAKWLQNYVATAARETAAKDEQERLSREDKAAEEAAESAKASTEDARKAKADQESKCAADFDDFLSSAASLNGLLETFIGHLKSVTGASAVYIAQKEVDENAAPPAEGEEEAPGGNAVLKYVAASEGQEFILEKKLPANKGVTFEVFAEDAPKEGEGEDGEGEEKAAVAVVENPVDKSVFVPNVMLGPMASKIYFHDLPRLGSYFAMRLPYEACLNEATMEQAAEKETEIMALKKTQEEEEAAAATAAAEAAAAEAPAEEGEGEGGEGGEGDGPAAEAEPEVAAPEETEEAKEERLKLEAAAAAEADELFLVSHLSKAKVDYVVCLDTLSPDGTRLDDSAVELARKYISAFKETLVRVDRALFKEERLKRATQAELAEGVEEPSAADVAAEKDKVKAALEKAGAPTTEADLQFNYRRGVLSSLRANIAEFRSYNVFRGSMAVLQALFYLVGFDKNSCADVDGKPVWSKIRLLFGDELFQKIQAYDPRDVKVRPKHATAKAIRALTKGQSYDDLKTKNPPLAELFGFIEDALAVKATAKAERAAAKKAEEEAAAAAAAEAAAPAEEEPAADGDAEPAAAEEE